MLGRWPGESVPESSGAVVVERFADHPECRDGAKSWEQCGNGVFVEIALRTLGCMPSDVVADAVAEAEAHHTRYQDEATEDRCFYVLVERVKDLLRQESGRCTIREVNGEEKREDGDAPTQDGQGTSFHKRGRVDTTSKTTRAVLDGENEVVTKVWKQHVDVGTLPWDSSGCPPLLGDHRSIGSNEKDFRA